MFSMHKRESILSGHWETWMFLLSVKYVAYFLS